MRLHPGEGWRRGAWTVCGLAVLLCALTPGVAGAQQRERPARPPAEQPKVVEPPSPQEAPPVNRISPAPTESPAVPLTPAVKADPMAVPGFWDPRRRPERPDLSRISIIRFLTETDYPPFNFTGADGNPAGFNIDLARSLCEEIKVTCTIQMRRFETLLDALTSNRGDAIIASMAVTPQMRERVDFTDPYYRAPARFASRKDQVLAEIRPEY